MANSQPTDWKKLNFYELLGVHKNATNEEIKKGYLAQAKLFHPDKHSDESKQEASERFKKIKDAYDVLKEEESRKTYDATLEMSVPQPTASKSQYNSRKKEMEDKIAYAVLTHTFADTITSRIKFASSTNNIPTHLTNWISARWFAPNDLQSRFSLKTSKELHVPHLLVQVNMKMTIYYNNQALKDRKIRTGLLICPVKNQKPLDPWRNYLFESTSQWNLKTKEPIEPQQTKIDANSLRSLVLQELQTELLKLELAVHSGLLLNHGSKVLDALFVEFSVESIEDEVIDLPLVLGFYDYKEEFFPFVLNGQNCEIKGARPVSKWKVVATGALGILAGVLGQLY